MTLQPNPKSTNLFRSESDRYLAGVCGGIAAYFELDSTLVRLAFIAIILLGGSGILIYLILWLIIPAEGVEHKSIMEATMTKIQTPQPKQPEKLKNSRSLWGLFLIGIGILMLLDNFGIGRYLMLEKTWPSIFIILGLLVLSR